jgi:hypothetical protein
MAKKSNRRTRKVGVACFSVAQFMKRIPDEYDYERMVNYDCDAIDTTKSYEEFKVDQTAAAATLNPEECERLKTVLALLDANKLEQIDLETCAPTKSTKIFFDKNGKIVLVNDR